MIEVRHLSKRYGTHLAVDDLSFSIDRGVVYGFLGPNGAGKSTTMNIMTGCLGATEGEVLIDGHNVAEEPMEAKKHIGYLPELPPLYGDMTPEEYLRFVARAKGLRETTVVVRHALKNALIPIITVIGMELGGLLGGSVLTETIFAWPGVGKYVVDGINNSDYAVVQGGCMLVAVVSVLMNLVVDLLYASLDPRIRY